MGIERPVARFRQVADELREAIQDGTYGPGSTLPSQPSLARHYGLTQASISRAIALLESEGLVRTEHGKGCFVLDLPESKRVRHIPPRRAGAGSAFAESMLRSGLRPRSELVRAELVEPPEPVAGHLKIERGELTLLRERQMYADDRPVQLAASYIPESVAGGVELAFPDTGPTGIHRRLAERGHRVARFAEQVEARRPTRPEAEFFGLASGQPVLEVTRFVYDDRARVLEVVVNVFAAHLWRLTHEWAADRPPEPVREPPKHSVSVTGVVVRPDGDVLAIKRADDHHWGPPGGVLELGETPEQGVVREVLEETGIEVRPERLVGVYKNIEFGVLSMVFLCRPVGGRERTSDESEAVVWLSPAQAEQRMPEARAVRVTDAFRDDGPFVRVHDGTTVLTPAEQPAADQ